MWCGPKITAGIYERRCAVLPTGPPGILSPVASAIGHLTGKELAGDRLVRTPAPAKLAAKFVGLDPGASRHRADVSPSRQLGRCYPRLLFFRRSHGLNPPARETWRGRVRPLRQERGPRSDRAAGPLAGRRLCTARMSISSPDRKNGQFFTGDNPGAPLSPPCPHLFRDFVLCSSFV